MPRARWGISAADVDNYDRDSGFTPYRGPIPPNGVYDWLLKQCKFVSGTRGKYPQLRLGLELAPREGSEDEKRYAGYFIMVFRSIAPQTAFGYVPFLDAIGVSGSDFEDRTVVDAEGNITRIGKWRNDGQQYVAAQLKDGADEKGNARKEIGWIGEISEEGYDDDDGEYDDDEDAF